MDNLFTAYGSPADIEDDFVHTVGVFRCVFDRTMSRKSFAVGTGAMALSPLVDIVRRNQRLFSPSDISIPYWEVDRTYARCSPNSSAPQISPPAGASGVEFWHSLREGECLVLAPTSTGSFFFERPAGCRRGKFWFGGNPWERTKLS